jgi:hypothetical protein
MTVKSGGDVEIRSDDPNFAVEVLLLVILALNQGPEIGQPD